MIADKPIGNAIDMLVVPAKDRVMNPDTISHRIG
jgi:hypothetical protein